MHNFCHFRFKEEYGYDIVKYIQWKVLYKNYMTTWLIGNISFEKVKEKQEPKKNIISILYDHIVDRFYPYTCSKTCTVFELNPNNNLPIDKPLKINNFRIKQEAAAGKEHVLLIDNNDNLFVLESMNENFSLNYWTNNLKVKRISAGHFHYALIDFDNNFWVFGNNTYGELGIGEQDSYVDLPQMVSNLKIKDVSCGFDFTIIIDMNNDLYSFGNNEYGQSRRGLTGRIRQQSIK